MISNLEISRLRKTSGIRKFTILNRHKRISNRLRVLLQSQLDYMDDMNSFLDGEKLEDVYDSFDGELPHEKGFSKLIDVARINGDLSNFLLSKEEVEIMGKYDLKLGEISKYREVANDIFCGDDRHVLNLLGISDVSLNDAYKKILYFIAEKCKNGREIRADFFN